MTRPRRPFVLVLNHFAVPPSGAGGTRHVELFSRLSEWDAEVVAGSRNMLSGERGPSAEGIWRSVWVPPSSGMPSRVISWCAYAFTAFLRGLLVRRPDVVYASSPQLLAGLAGLALARIRRSHFVLEIRDLWPQVLVDMGILASSSRVTRSLRSLEALLYRQAETIVVMAPGVQDHLASRGLEGKLRLIPNGADPEHFDVIASRDRLRERLGLHGFVVAYTGAHGRANGLDLLLDAAASVAPVAPQVCFLLVGDGPLKADLQARTLREGLTNVRFMGPVSKSRMPELLAAVDVGLHVLADVPLFRYGVSPNKLYDYMAAGLPVITNTEGEVGELVRQAHAGLAVAPDGIGPAVVQMASATPDQLEKWGRSASEYVRAYASRTAMARRLEAVLDDCRARRPGWRSQ